MLRGASIRSAASCAIRSSKPFSISRRSLAARLTENEAARVHNAGRRRRPANRRALAVQRPSVTRPPSQPSRIGLGKSRTNSGLGIFSRLSGARWKRAARHDVARGLPTAVTLVSYGRASKPSIASSIVLAPRRMLPRGEVAHAGSSSELAELAETRS